MLGATLVQIKDGLRLRIPCFCVPSLLVSVYVFLYAVCLCETKYTLFGFVGMFVPVYTEGSRGR